MQRCWVLVVAATLTAQEPQTPPAEKPAAPWPIVAPTDEWYDATRLAAVVGELRPMAEKHSGLTFARDPVVRVADDESWIRLVGEEMPNARDPYLAVAITFALYLPQRDEVVLSSHLAHGLLSREREKGRPAARAMVVHELVHVLQEQHFQLPSRMRAAKSSDKLVMRSMVEGFATWVEERAAVAELGLPTYEEYSARRHRENKRMEYLRGRDFFAAVHASGGEKAIHDAMRNEPLPLTEFAAIALKGEKLRKAAARQRAEEQQKQQPDAKPRPDSGETKPSGSGR